MVNVVGCMMYAGWGDVVRGAARASFPIQLKPRFRSEKSAADAKLEKTSLSAGGFLRVSVGYRSGYGLRYQQAWKRCQPTV